MLKVESLKDKNGILEILANHFALRLFKKNPLHSRNSESVLEISTDEDFWKFVLERKLLPGSLVNLIRFNVLEWFPRVPGLYHHPRSQAQRAAALEFVDSILSRELEYDRIHFANGMPAYAANFTPSVPDEMRETISRYANVQSPIDRRALLSNNGILLDESFSNLDSTIVFDPYGKQTMLKSGVGSVRLRPLQIEGELCWLCSASSLGWSDHGVPLAIPDQIFRKIYPEIRETGCALVDLSGELRFVSRHNDRNTLARLYNTASGVPHVYVYVNAIYRRYPLSDKNGELKVCAAVTFQSSYEGDSERIYATYVGFNPAIEDDLDNAVDWMSEKYVSTRYKGQIITDFDEQIPRFSNALFSLEYTNSTLELAKVKQTFKQLGLAEVPAPIRQYIQIESVKITVNDMSNKVHVSGTAGIVAGGSVTNSGQVAVSHRENGIAPASLETLLKPFVDVLSTSGLSTAQQSLIKAQLDVLREEAAKPTDARDKTTISNTLDGLKRAADVASLLKAAWDTFGSQLGAWFSVSSGTTI